MTDKELMQACINEYDGEYGKVRKVYDLRKKFKKDHVQGSFGWIDGEPGTIYINFCGSKELLDWWDNFKFWKKNFWTEKQWKKIIPYECMESKIKVHAGFIGQWKQVRSIIHEEIQKYNKIIVTGHSLGGAIANLCVLDIQYFNPDKELSVITFGAPDVGNKYFVKSFNKRIKNSKQYINGDDIVTKVPPWLFGYRKVIKVIKIGVSHWYFKISGTHLDHYPRKYIKNMS